MKRAAFAGVVMLVLVAFPILVGGQSAIGQQEDFEDDTANNSLPETSTNNSPTSEWYTYGQGACNTGTNHAAGVVTPGLDGTGKKFRIFVGASGSCFATFTLTSPQQFSNMTFHMDSVLGTDNTNHWSIRGTNGAFVMIWTANKLSSVSCGGTSFCWQVTKVFGMDGALPHECVTSATNTVVLDPSQSSQRMFGELKVSMVFDWSAKNIDWTFEEQSGTEKTFTNNNVPFCNAGSPNDFRQLILGNNFANQDPGIFFDQWQLDGGPLPVVEEVPLGPEEFDQGLLNAVGRVGFISPGSEILFVIIVFGVVFVGVAGGLRWFGSGRGKNNTVLGIPAAFGVLFIALGYLDLWMYILALMLGLLAVNSGSLVVNTYRSLLKSMGNFGGRREEDMDEMGEEP